MLSVDCKKNLACALRQQLPFDGTNKLLHFGVQGLQDDQIIQALCVRGIGSVPIPVSCQHILKLIGGAPSSVSTNVVDDSQPSLSSSLTVNLTNFDESTLLDKAIFAVKNMTNIDLSGGISIRLNQLSICTQKGQHHRKTSNLKKPSGIFGKFIIQIPVEGGYEGGRLKLRKTDEDVTYFEFDQQSDRHFFAATFFSDLKHDWQPVQRGNMVALEYDLVWQPIPGLIPSHISPAFFVALQSAKEILRPWDQSAKKVENGNTVPEQQMQTKVPPEFSGDSAKTGSTHLDASRDHLLIIPLTGIYYENNFNFTSLHGSDRQMANILQSIDFIDVHLAVVSQGTGNPTVPRELAQANCFPSTGSFQIAHWIYSSISLPQFRDYHLDLSNQLIGELGTNLFWNGKMERMPRHAVIVIQPRHQSIRRCCDFHFHAMLDYLESRILSDNVSKKSCLYSTRCIEQTISYCKQEPLKVWDVPANTAAERTKRLVDICRDLKAEDEFLSLVKLLGEDFSRFEQLNNGLKSRAADCSSNGNSSVFFEGVRNELVARSIVKILVDTGGWQKFSASILGLISPNRLQEQLKSFAFMVLVLLENLWVSEATDVTQKIVSAISSNFDVLKYIDQLHIDAYFNALMALEAVVKESVLERFVDPVFIKLDFNQQCRLLVALKKHSGSSLEVSPSCLLMYEEMCLMFLRRGLCNSGHTAGVVADVVSCFVELDNKNILTIFIDKVLWNNGVSETNNIWLEELIAISLLSTFAKDTLIECLNKRLDVFKKVTLEPPGSDEETKRDPTIRFFLVILRLERTPQLAFDAKMHSVVHAVVSTMPYRRLVNLAADLVEKGSARMKEHQSGIKMLLYIAHLLLDRDCSLSDGEPPIHPIVEILKCLLAYNDDGFVSVKKLIQLVSHCDKWSLRNRNLIIETIFFSSVMWNDYSGKIGTADAADIVRQCLKELMASWIAGLVQMFDAPTIDKKAATEKRSLLNISTTACFLCYIREQKKHLTFGDDAVNPFPPLLSRMTPHQLGYLMWNVYKSDANEPPSLKKFPFTLKLYTDLCRLFLDMDVGTVVDKLSRSLRFFNSWKTTSITVNMLIETVSCCLWLADEKCIDDLAFQISILYPDEPNKVILQLIRSSEIRQLADSFPQVRDSFRQLLSIRVELIAGKLATECAPAWKMPSASLPDHPVVEQFLHSAAQQMTYSNFSNKKQALKFVSLLTSLESINGYSLRAKVRGQHFNSKCEIVKVKTVCGESKKSNLGCTSRLALLGEKTNLEKIISSLQQRKRNRSNSQNEMADWSVVDNEIVYFPAVKKEKLDNLHVVDIAK